MTTKLSPHKWIVFEGLLYALYPSFLRVSVRDGGGPYFDTEYEARDFFNKNKHVYYKPISTICSFERAHIIELHTLSKEPRKGFLKTLEEARQVLKKGLDDNEEKISKLNKQHQQLLEALHKFESLHNIDTSEDGFVSITIDGIEYALDP